MKQRKKPSEVKYGMMVFGDKKSILARLAERLEKMNLPMLRAIWSICGIIEKLHTEEKENEVS